MRLEQAGAGYLLVSGKDSFPLRFSSETEATEIRSEPAVRYRFRLHHAGRPAFMVRVKDGETWDFNDGPQDLPGPDLPEWKPFVGEYVATVWGKPVSKVRLERKNGYLYFDELRLEQHLPGLFFASNGEALDLRTRPPTFANARLTRVTDP